MAISQETFGGLCSVLFRSAFCVASPKAARPSPPPPPIGLSHLSIILFCALSTRKFHCLSHLGTIFNIRPRGRQFPKWCTFFDTTRAPGADADAENTFLGHEVCIKTKISSSRAIGTVVTVGIRAILTCAVGNHRLGVCIRFSR